MSTAAGETNPGRVILDTLTPRFRSQKDLAEKAIAQATKEDLFWSPDPESNSVAVLMQHMAGNMLSRWTGFLNTDGEKPNRNRDSEFQPGLDTREELMARWQEGWRCLFAALDDLSDDDLLRTVTIRGEALSALDAIVRQLSHYAVHVGQIVYIVKARRGEGWHSLSIPRKR